VLFRTRAAQVENHAGRDRAASGGDSCSAPQPPTLRRARPHLFARPMWTGRGILLKSNLVGSFANSREFLYDV
jgi:hypothetical protein